MNLNRTLGKNLTLGKHLEQECIVGVPFSSTFYTVFLSIIEETSGDGSGRLLHGISDLFFIVTCSANVCGISVQ